MFAMSKALSTMCAATLAVGAAFAAQTYSSSDLGYRIAFPDGWTISEDKDKPGAVFAETGKVGDYEARRICGMQPSSVDETRLFSQAQINAEMGAPFGEEFWQDASDEDQKNLKVLKSAARLHPSGMVAREGEFSFEGSDGNPKNMRMRLSVMAAPGAVYAIVCMAEVRAFDKYQHEFAGVIESFRHKAALDSTVNLLPAPGTVPVASKLPGLSQNISKAAALAVAKVQVQFQR